MLAWLGQNYISPHGVKRHTGRPNQVESKSHQKMTECSRWNHALLCSFRYIKCIRIRHAMVFDFDGSLTRSTWFEGRDAHEASARSGGQLDGTWRHVPLHLEVVAECDAIFLRENGKGTFVGHRKIAVGLLCWSSLDSRGIGTQKRVALFAICKEKWRVESTFRHSHFTVHWPLGVRGRYVMSHSGYCWMLTLDFKNLLWINI